MTIRVHRSGQARHLVFQASTGDLLPDALIAGLRQEGVTHAWLRGSGVLADVELSAFDARLGRAGEVRRIAGMVQLVSLESSVGLAGATPGISLRAVLARESDLGLETFAGELLSGRVVAFEAWITILEEFALDRAADIATTKTATWSAAADIGSQNDREPVPPVTRSLAASPGMAAPMPQRPTRPAAVHVDSPIPEPGDVVDHFAFGRCDVIKSDGDRLHLRVHKDGRIKEIALEMLRVTALENDGPTRRYKLERRI